MSPKGIRTRVPKRKRKRYTLKKENEETRLEQSGEETTRQIKEGNAESDSTDGYSRMVLQLSDSEENVIKVEPEVEISEEQNTQVHTTSVTDDCTVENFYLV